MKKIFVLSSFLLLFFLSFQTSYAQENFSTSYNARYDVLENGNTKVTLQIALQNKTSEFFASSYMLQTGFKNINSIGILDSQGNVSYKTAKDSKGTTISFDFNKNVVGINESQNFTVYFETAEVAKNFGSIFEVNIPGIADQEEYSSFNAEIRVPPSFGKATFIKPNVENLKSSGNSIFFSKNDLGQSGISISYGKQQIYEFDLTYHLQNNNLFGTTKEIAIPSNNNYQEVQIDSISPRPSDVYIDNDGNWLAKFYLQSGKKQNIIVRGRAKVTFAPRKEILSESKKNLYLKPLPFWEQTPQIKKIAQELKTPEKIYRFVVDNLSYDPTRVKETQVRAGAEAVLRNKMSAVCLEFTDLFVALSRAAGIPARSVEGFANTKNSVTRPLSLKDVLHSWPQFYDFEKEAWIMVDPTWENTTAGIDYFNVFDFDHFAFVIKGQKSDYPIPAGGYKSDGEQNTKDVSVSTSESYSRELPILTASTNFKETYMSGLPIEGEIIINNFSKVLAPNQTLNVSSKSLTPASQNLYFDKIPPYGKRIIPVKFDHIGFLTKETGIVKITIEKETIEVPVVISPIYTNIKLVSILGGVLFGSVTIILSIATYKRRRIPVS